MKGNIVRKVTERGFGFIIGEDGGEYFFHFANLINISWDELSEGDCVRFSVVNKGEKREAVNVSKYYGEVFLGKKQESKVFPGKHPNIILTSFSDEEKKIINTLAKTFYVTNGGETIKLGSTSEYRYCLVKPTEEFIIQFNLNREIIVVFSKYESFEPRTFDAISEVYRRNTQQFRIDKICSIVVSKDKEVVPEIRKMLKSDIEMQVIIPFSYTELSNGDRTELIVSRFKEYFFDRDLFAFEAPLRKDIYFFGRRDYVHNLISRHNSGENSGVFGLRRSGKTSVLQAVKRAATIIGTMSVIIDCQEMYHYSWNKALFYVMSCIYDDANLKYEIGLEEYTEENATSIFSRDLGKIIGEGKDIIILFDEVEQITPNLSLNPCWKEGDDFIKFWHSIRSNFNKFGNKFTFILAGTNPSAVELISFNKHENPLFNQLKADSYLPPFNVEDTKEMVNKLGGYMGLTFDDIVCSNLTKDFGGHPYLIRHFCSAINKYLIDNRNNKPIKITNILYEKVMPNFVENSADNFCKFILEVLVNYYPEENKFLENLALGNSIGESNSQIDPKILSHLMGYNIIEKNQNVLGFKIDVLKNYIKRKNSYKKQNMTLEEKWAEISERRNRIEPRLRTIVRTQLKARYGETAAKQKVINSMKTEIRKRYTNLPYTDLFDPKKCQIYFMQLGDLIDKYWNECFKNIFLHNQRTIKSFFTIINTFRVECHAKDITDDEMDSFRGAMGTLEKEVNNFYS